MQRHIRSGSSTAANRQAFSLIEMLIVMVIIGILMSMLLVAGRNVTATVRVNEVIAEINNLGQGIKEFEGKFMLTEPFPSRIVLYERYADWPNASTSTDVSVQRNATALRRLWPEFLDNTGRPKLTMFAQDLNGDGDATDTFELSGAECLVFFLGGVLQQQDAMVTPPTYLPTGFSTNPVNPFAAGGSRVGPFVEFKSARLIDRDGNSFPEYVDAFSGSTSPYLYFSAYGGRGYRVLGDDNAIGGTGRNADEAPAFATGASPQFQFAYLQKEATTMPSMPAVYWNAKTYQIISAGPDKIYGQGGLYDASQGLYASTVPQSRRAVEQDNVTNFGGQMSKSN